MKVTQIRAGHEVLDVERCYFYDTIGEIEFTFKSHLQRLRKHSMYKAARNFVRMAQFLKCFIRHIVLIQNNGLEGSLLETAP